MGRGRTEDDHRELANRLFATVTAMLEDAIGVAVKGQSPRLAPAQLADHGRRLQAAVREIAAIAEAAIIIVSEGNNRPPARRQPPI